MKKILCIAFAVLIIILFWISYKKETESIHAVAPVPKATVVPTPSVAPTPEPPCGECKG